MILKIQGQSTPVSAASSWLISIVFQIRASYWLPSPLFHDIQVSHSRDTIWPWQFKVEGTPVSPASRWLISLVFHIRASYPLPSLLFHAIQASHSWDTIWSWKFKVKGQGERYPSQCSDQLTHFLKCFTSGHPIDSRPFRSITIRPPIPKIRFDLENSRSKVKVKGTLVSVASSWLISFLFHINWTNPS